MSILQTLITDRTAADVARVRELKKKLLAGETLTPDEQTEYFGNPKGAYNYKDLNRVGEAVKYIHDLYAASGRDIPNYTTPKTDWTIQDVPTITQAAMYMDNIWGIKNLCRSKAVPPLSLHNLSYNLANAIEKVLVDAENDAMTYLRDWLYSGEFEAGEF